jgi:protein TonB
MAYAIIVLVLLGLSLLLTIDGSWMNLMQAARNQLVFANHNQDYGAFELRRDYNRRLAIALIAAVLFVGIAIGTPKVIASLGKGDEEVKKRKVVDVELELFKEENEPPPPPPPEIEPPPQPKIETVQFVAVEASEKPTEEPPPTQADLQETVASTQTQEGEKGDEAPPPTPVEEEVFDLAAVQEQPEFPGGMEKMYEFMQRTQKYPDMEYEAGIQGKVYVQFTVDKDGSIEEAKVLRSVSEGLDKEAMRLVKSMPKWNPGKMGGKPVKCRFNLPVVFKLK